MNQSEVKNVYLRVIDATIEGARAEFIEKGFNDKIEILQLLKERWSARLTEIRDFTDDPEIIVKPASSAKGSKAKKNKKVKDNPNLAPVMKDPEKKSPGKSQKSSDKQTHSTQNGKVSVENLTNAENNDPVPIPRKQKSETDKRQLGTDVITIPDDEPPAKRQRRDNPAEKEVNKSENLDSSDSDEDIRGVDEEEEEKAENFILAQHDRLRKGNKWKIPLREGIIHIRGREYLFNRATCDLEF